VPDFQYAHAIVSWYRSVRRASDEGSVPAAVITLRRGY
jgi:hypothetical protein